MPALTRRHLEVLRLPIIWWAAVVALALVTALAVWSQIEAARAAGARYGHTRLVVVASRTLEPGETLRAGDVEVREWPVALVPAGALHKPPLGTTLRAEVAAGEPLLAARIAGGRRRGAAARLPGGWRGIALPHDRSVTPPLEPGDLVDVLVTLADAGASAEAPPTVVVARAAVVVEVNEDAVTVGVRAGDVERVAYGVAAGVVTVVLVA